MSFNRRFNIAVVLVIFGLLGTFGALSIYKSQVHYDVTPCKLLNITLFKCKHLSLTIYRVYESNSKMPVLLNDTAIKIMTTDYCLTCDDCKNLYVIGSTYNCTMINDSYQILKSTDQICTSCLISYGICLIIGFVITMPVLYFLITHRNQKQSQKKELFPLY